MQTFWQKLWLWFRSFLLLAVFAHVVLFLILNMRAVVDPELSLIYASYAKPGLLLVLLSTAVISIFGWWLFWTVFRTIRQIRESNMRGNQVKLEKKLADMEQKASMLQTKPVGPGTSTSI